MQDGIPPCIDLRRRKPTMKQKTNHFKLVSMILCLFFILLITPGTSSSQDGSDDPDIAALLEYYESIATLLTLFPDLFTDLTGGDAEEGIYIVVLDTAQQAVEDAVIEFNGASPEDYHVSYSGFGVYTVTGLEDDFYTINVSAPGYETVSGEVVYGNSTSGISSQQIIMQPLVQYKLTVTKIGNGTVESVPAGISCGEYCHAEFEEGAEITLSAVPDSGSVFIKWGEDCSGATECHVTMSEDRHVSAVFLSDNSIVVEPLTYEFGRTSPETFSSPQTFTILNSGETEMTITDLSLTGADTSEFRIEKENCSGKTLSASDHCTADILFSPASEGHKEAVLSVSPGIPDMPATEIRITGFGYETGIYRFERMWPTLRQPWYFVNPQGITMDKSGYVYVMDSGNHRIQKFTSDGAFVTKWGRKGSGNGEFGSIEDFGPFPGIITDREGNVYVADSGNHRIQKFTSDGDFVAKWGKAGRGEGEFNSPEGMVIDSEGFIYVADSKNHRIQKFTTDGVFTAKWGQKGIRNGEFNEPKGIAIDSEGNVYVTDSLNYRIQKFSPDGAFLMKWGSFASDGVGESYPESIVIDGEGHIYVAQRDNIYKFGPGGGSFISEWLRYNDNERFQTVSGMVIDHASGEMYVVEGGSRNRILKFRQDASFINKWGSGGSGEGEFIVPHLITMDQNGDIYIADAGNFRIQKFNSDGRFITQWGSKGTFSDADEFAAAGIAQDEMGSLYLMGTQSGQFLGIGAIATDSKGDVYVSDSGGNRIQKFTSDGELITKWGTFGALDGQLLFPQGIAIDSNDNIYVADTANNRIQKFTTEGVFVSKWGERGSDHGKLEFPFRIAIDSQDRIYIIDSETRIQKFELDGTFITAWGDEGSGDGAFKEPAGIALDGKDYVYVVDRGDNSVKKFTSDGYFVEKFGKHGFAPNQLNHPGSLCVSPDGGQVYVADTGNNRIQILKKIPMLPKNKAIIVAGGGPHRRNNLWDTTQMVANFAYRTLIYQGFTKETIHYLTSDTELDLDDNNEADDVDGPARNENLRTAITEWALEEPTPDSLIIYLTDHGGDGIFMMSLRDGENLSASDLGEWLDTLQETIPVKVTVVYDACESGSFLSPHLVPPDGKKRIVITSTSPEQNALFVTKNSVSFSNYFWSHIFSGFSVGDAFELGREAVESAMEFQNPLMDDNGDGAYDANDGNLAQKTYIGNGTVIRGDAPLIARVVPDQTITGTHTALLYASGVTDDDGIDRVWAMIRPPDYNPGDPDMPVQNMPSVELTPAEGEAHRYEGVYENFNQTGDYQIAVYARDRDGNTSIPKLSTVSVESPMKRRAIILLGGSEQNELWQTRKKLGRLVYDALKSQGYSDEDVYFMSPVSFSSGVDGLPVLDNLSHAITMAKKNTQDMVLYLVGTGGMEVFEINETEILSAADLGQWLNDLQESIPGRVIVIYDACRSESFHSSLMPASGKERILIFSTGENQPAHFLPEGEISFSRFFWDCVLNGVNINDAFWNAYDALICLCDNQRPGFNIYGNHSRDYTIGFGIIKGDIAPLIRRVSPEQTLNGEKTAHIRAGDINTTGSIAKVWAVIAPPGHQSFAGCSVADMPAVELLYNSGSGMYEGTYDNFSCYGRYGVTVYARDTEGNISLPVATGLVQNTGMTGDINGDCEVDLADVLLVLKVLAEEDADLIQDYAASGADVNGDHKIGMAEAVHILQKLGDTR